MNKISCFAVSKITNAVKGNKHSGTNQNSDENHDYTNSDGNGSSSLGTPLLKRHSKVSSVPDIEVIQEVAPKVNSQNVQTNPTSLTHHPSINSIPNNFPPHYANHVYLQHHQQLSQPSSPMLPSSQMSHYRNYNNHHYKVSAPSSPQLTPRCTNFYPFPSANCSANNTSTAINEMLNGKHRHHGSKNSIHHPPSSPSLSQHCKSPSRQRKMVMYPASNYSNDVTNGYSTMEVQNAAFGALKDEVMDLTCKVKQLSKERDYLEKELNTSQLEKLRVCRERDDILDNQSLRYEERLVELHSVIAELSRQLEQKSRERITEEDDDDTADANDNDADTSCENNSDIFKDASGTQVGANTSKEKHYDKRLASSKSDVLSRTSTDMIDAEAVEAGNRLAEHLDGGDLCAFLRLSRSVSRSITHSSATSLQVYALQEELSDTKELNIQLSSRLQQKERDLDEARRNIECLSKEKEKLRNKVSEMEEEKLQMTPALRPRKSSATPLSPGVDRKALKEVNGTGKGTDCDPTSSDVAHMEEDDTNLLRMAERKKIRKMEDVDSNGDHHQPVTGSELSSVGVRNSVVVEHLVQDIQDKSAMQEFSHSFTSTPFNSLNGENTKEDGNKKQMESDKHALHRKSLVESKLQEFEIEMERLSSRIEHLRSQNEVLNLSLEESKNQCDNLTVLIGKYESNHTAEKLAIDYADHIIEALETLVALIESEMVVTFATCKAEKSGNYPLTIKSLISSEIPEKELLQQANESRHVAEEKAKKLLSKLESFARPDSGIVSAPESSHNAFASGASNSTSTSAWEESSGYSQNTGSAASLESNRSGPHASNTSIASSGFIFSYKAEVQHQFNFFESSVRTDEVKLKDFVARLKNARSSIQSTIATDLESMHAEDGGPERTNVNENRTADLEMAVLVQELMAMREEKADLRRKVYIIEKEKKSLELTIGSLNAQEVALKTHIQHLQDELENHELLEIDSQANNPHRNEEFKERITELLTTLEKVKRNSELKQQQADDLIIDLKKSNSALADSLEKTKKKYQSRLKRMEQQILQHLLHNQLTDPRDSQVDNDSIDRIEAEIEGTSDVTKTSDLVTSWIPKTNGSVLSILSSESEQASE